MLNSSRVFPSSRPMLQKGAQFILTFGCQATIKVPSCRVVMFLFLGQDLYSISFLSIQIYQWVPTKHAVLDPQLIQKVFGRGAVIFLGASCSRKLS